jgi:hypothetical protein
MQQRLKRPVVSVKSVFETSQKTVLPASPGDADAAIMQIFASASTPPPLFDLQYHVPVISDTGFQLQLHSADNLAKNIEYTFGIIRVESPASKIGAKIWTMVDGASQYRSPEWKDGLATFAPVQAVRQCVQS